MYEDPSNYTELLSELGELAGNHNAIYEFINRVFPGWILYSVDDYSKDYSYLENNWKFMCVKLSIDKGKIVIVDAIHFDDSHKLLGEVCDMMTKSGYIVRRKEELIPCTVCGKALMSEPLWMKMRNTPIQEVIPREWAERCGGC